MLRVFHGCIFCVSRQLDVGRHPGGRRPMSPVSGGESPHPAPVGKLNSGGLARANVLDNRPSTLHVSDGLDSCIEAALACDASTMTPSQTSSPRTASRDLRH